MKEIKLTQGKVALVDDEDFEYLSQWKWHTKKNTTKNCVNFYAVRSGGAKLNYHLIFMHKEVLKTTELVDHRNRNGLDNRRENLRVATRSQNAKNRKAWGASKYIGVSPNVDKTRIPFKHRWAATIFVNGKNKNLGRFDNEVDAARKYDAAAKEIHGEFANLNFK